MTARKAASILDQNTLKITNVGAPTAASTDAARIIDVETASTNDRSRANHTGTQLANTISDFDTQVRTSRLDQMAAPTAAVSLNSQKITNLADPTVSTDAANKNYVDTAIAGITSGLNLKGSVRAAVTANVTIATPGATLDGLTAVVGEVFLLTGQTTASQNGPYVFQGAASAMTRTTNFDVSAEALLGSFWVVQAGTNADKFAVMTNDVVIVLGTTSLTFSFISTGGGGSAGFAVNCPVVTAGGSWVVNHALASTDCVVSVKRVASPFDFIDVYAETTDANNITIKPDIAFASAEYRALVSKVV